MHIIIDTYGASLSIENNMFCIEIGKDKRSISAFKVKSINILKPINLTSAAILLASSHQIPLLLYNKIGQVEALTWSSKYVNIANIRKYQYQLADSKIGVYWMKDIISLKLQEQYALIKFLKLRIVRTEDFMDKLEIVFNKHTEELKYAREFDTIRISEAICSKYYWFVISKILVKYVQFTRRETKSAKQHFNICLNYGYGILYGMVESSILMVGLDPSCGIMHANQYAAPALAFDHIEPFRPWVDMCIVDLWMKQRVSVKSFELDESGAEILTLQARKTIISTVLEMLDSKAYFMGKRIKKRDHILNLNQQLVNLIKSKIKK